jgi:hypothetical protein
VKTFYSAVDIEELASQGVRELVVDADTVLTSVAREAAAQLGVKLVAPGQGAPAVAASPATQPATPLKPRGCQHGPAGKDQSQVSASNRGAGGSASPVVDDLIGVVKQLARQG